MISAVGNFWSSYFGPGKGAEYSDVQSSLWNSGVTPGAYTGDGEKYQNAILEQYKICLEMADRISARRGQTNTFFLTLNTAVFTLIGAAWKFLPDAPPGLLVAPLLVLVVQCMSWFWLVRSYRQLNTAKYLVVGALEERLPASPFYNAEWKALAEGDDKRVYWPLTHVEQWIPPLFAAAYLGGFLAFAFS